MMDAGYGAIKGRKKIDNELKDVRILRSANSLCLLDVLK